MVLSKLLLSEIYYSQVFQTRVLKHKTSRHFKTQRNCTDIVLTENIHIDIYLFLTKNFKLPSSNFEDPFMHKK